MVAEPSAKQLAWILFDRIVAEAAHHGQHSNPWKTATDGSTRIEPDFGTLERLLGVPLHLGASTQSGVPALALDVWLSYELRRAGFDPDATWPRAVHPRILPMPVAHLLRSLPRRDREMLQARLAGPAIPGVTSSSADILGKNYLKQVDVIMSNWRTGPELLISTKRMDSSYGKNAANRIEESYGDAKNLRLRHPLAALGFVYGLRSDILIKEPETAEWLIDLLGKLGHEDDAYHATCLLMIEYGNDAGPVPDAGDDNDSDTASTLTRLPRAEIRQDAIPADLSPSRFLTLMVNRVLDATPVTLHKPARARRRSAVLTESSAVGEMGSARDTASSPQLW